MCSLVSFSEEHLTTCSIVSAFDNKDSNFVFAMSLDFAIRNDVDRKFVEFHLEVNAVLIVEAIPALFLVEFFKRKHASADILHYRTPHAFKIGFVFFELSFDQESSLIGLVLEQVVIVIFLISFDSEIPFLTFALTLYLPSSLLADDVKS